MFIPIALYLTFKIQKLELRFLEIFSIILAGPLSRYIAYLLHPKLSQTQYYLAHTYMPLFYYPIHTKRQFILTIEPFIGKGYLSHRGKAIVLRIKRKSINVMRSMMKKGVFYIHPHKMDAHLEHMNISILEKLSGIEWDTRQTKQGTLYVSYKTMTKEAAKAHAEQLSAFLPTGIAASNKEPNLFRVAVRTEAIEEYSNQKVKKSNGLR